MRFLLLNILSCMCMIAMAQNDSLERASEHEPDRAKKTELLIKLANQEKNADPLLSFNYASKAAALARSINDRDKEARAEIFMALYYNKSEKPDSILYFTRKNIPLLSASHTNNELLVDFINIEGAYYMRLNRQREALQRYYASFRIAETAGDALSKIKCQTNIGWAYMELNQFDTAVVYFKNALALMQSNNLDVFAAVYNNAASCFGDLKQYDSATVYVTKGITIAQQQNDPVSEANGLNILGTILQWQKKYDKALEVLLKAKTIRAKTGDPFFIVSDLATISDLYALTGKWQKGIEAANQALKMATENNITAKYPMIYESLAHNYEVSGNFKQASDVYKKLNTIKDSIYASASPQALAEMKTKYETEKKEKQIQLQQSQLRQKNTLIAGSVALLLLVVLLGLTQYRRYQWKQEARMRSAILNQQQLASKAVVEAEEGERQRIARDLHDGVGQVLSAAKMNLSAYEDRTDFKTPADRQTFEKIILLVDESCREVRAISHNMMPNALLKSNLASAIREFVHRLDQEKLKVQLYMEGLEERMDAHTETVLYRVIQECVHNVIKHAKADVLDISLARDVDGIRGTIEDNGKGFDTTILDPEQGLGLKNIRTRIEYLRGMVEFDSTPGRGTLVAFFVPL